MRGAAAFGIGIVAAALAFVAGIRPSVASDFSLPWRGAQLLLAGSNPYHVLAGGLPAPFEEPLYYPLSTLLLSAPLAGLAFPVAVALLLGGSCAVLAYLATREDLWRLWLFASAPVVVAVHVGQWSPLLTAAALLPAAGFLYLAKPNLGLALFLAQPTRQAALGCSALLAVSLVLLPSWPWDWRANLTALAHHPAPLTTLWGAPLCLALARWRRPEARLIFAMACVPQLLFFADQLPLWLVPRTRRETVMLSACSLVAFGGWFVTARFISPDLPYVPQAAPWVTFGCYLPATVMVLCRPNEGDVPAWLERWLVGTPEWLKGTSIRE